MNHLIHIINYIIPQRTHFSSYISISISLVDNQSHLIQTDRSPSSNRLGTNLLYCQDVSIRYTIAVKLMNRLTGDKTPFSKLHTCTNYLNKMKALLKKDRNDSLNWKRHCKCSLQTRQMLYTNPFCNRFCKMDTQTCLSCVKLFFFATSTTSIIAAKPCGTYRLQNIASERFTFGAIIFFSCLLHVKYNPVL